MDYPPAEVCRAAASGGHIEVLAWARASGFLWDASCCAAAAHAGRLATLMWLKERGCAWDKTTTSYAAIEGHNEVLEWSRCHGCEYSEETVLRMKMAQLQLAMRAGASSRLDGQLSFDGAHAGENGLVMVRRHAPCWPEGRT